MFKLKIYYEDTDAGGIVYYANYLKFLERARTQILHDNNFTHTYLKEKYEIFLIVKSCNLNFIKPAKLDDDIFISTTIIRKSKVQILLDQRIYCNSSIILNSEVKIVTINVLGKVSRMPIKLYNIF
jgi:acyl-CoA thioester hydrolase